MKMLTDCVIPVMSNTWNKVMAMKSKDTRHDGVANNLTIDEMECILGTVDYFGGSVPQAHLDIYRLRYRIFDWLAMNVMGNRINSEDATKVLVHSFLKVDGDIDKWLYDLQTVDYDMDNSWKEINLDA